MPSPPEQVVPADIIDPSLTGDARYVLFGTKWGLGLGTGADLTFSFPDSRTLFSNDYDIEPDSLVALSSGERNGVRQALGAWAAVSDVTFQEVTDSFLGAGNFRFARTGFGDEDEAAHAYLPTDHPAGGDVWFINGNWNTSGGTPRLGSYDYFVMLHEIGHALGLKHSFETPDPIPAEFDQSFYTVMSYTISARHTIIDVASYYPTTPMYYDILAMQALYGRNANANPGDTVYTFVQSQTYFQTIDDAGGNDTIVFQGTRNATITLNEKEFSDVSQSITFGIGNGVKIGATVAIGPNTLIENATGGSGYDTLIGNALANVLNGGVGGDTMEGRDGGDLYYVDNLADRVIEQVTGTGTDRVIALISYAMTPWVENLVLAGAALNGIGNLLNNTITGTVGANTLNGGLGDDTLIGGGGNDLYIVDAAGDMITEALGAGTDAIWSPISFTLAANVENLLLTGAAHINGTGNELANTITGNIGWNVLDGGVGADRMVGGDGADAYYVDNIGDVVVELANQGNDIVVSTITYTLTANVERLKLAGVDAINGFGNALANTLTGNAAANTLNGLTGADTMIGGDGNDIYLVDNALDVVTENFGEGTDVLISQINLMLPQNVENLVLLGASALVGRGNELGNRITGNDANNFLFGGLGADTLIGGAGGDRFVFNTALGPSNIDTITDFNAQPADAITLDHLIFAALNPGALAPAFFELGSAALSADDRILYDISTGALFYDEDGDGAALAVQFATLSTLPTVTAADFIVI